MLNRLIKLSISLSLIALIISCQQKDTLHPLSNIDERLQTEPMQRSVQHDAITVSQNDTPYLIQPRYSYTLNGIVVSFRHHNGNRLLHKLWDDHLNVADICVVWAQNTQLNFEQFDFRSGAFTCFISSQSRSDWQQFNPTQLSNNHLITTDQFLREQIQNVAIGDHIQVRGWLAEYKNLETGSIRNTSTTRTDTGNGACETLLVDHFYILNSPNAHWNTLYNSALWLLILSIIGWFIAVIRGKI